MTDAEIRKIVKTYNDDFFATTNPIIIDLLLKYLFTNEKAIEISNKQYFYTKLNAYESKRVMAPTGRDAQKPLA